MYSCYTHRAQSLGCLLFAMVYGVTPFEHAAGPSVLEPSDLLHILFVSTYAPYNIYTYIYLYFLPPRPFIFLSW